MDVVSACYLNVLLLAIDLNTGELVAAMSLQSNIVWVGKLQYWWHRNFYTSLWICSCRFINGIFQQPVCSSSLHFSQTVCAVASHLIKITAFILLGVVSSESSPAASTNSETGQTFLILILILILILMHRVNAIRRQDPILSITSADKVGALSVSGAARDLCLKLSTVLLLSPVLSCFSRWQSFGKRRISLDSGFCWSYRLSPPFADYAVIIEFFRCSFVKIMCFELNLTHTSLQHVNY